MTGLEGLVLFVRARRTQFVTGLGFVGGKVGGLAALLGCERREQLISPLIYFIFSVKLRYCI